jgi:hypothetical protein
MVAQVEAPSANMASTALVVVFMICFLSYVRCFVSTILLPLYTGEP